jgi:hypothetical protein
MKTPTQEHFYSCVGVLLAALFEGVTQKFSFYENPFVAPRESVLFVFSLTTSIHRNLPT